MCTYRNKEYNLYWLKVGKLTEPIEKFINNVKYENIIERTHY
jgi:hypothetical protein